MKQSKIKRFIVNNYDQNKININEHLKNIYNQIKIAEKSSKENYPPNMSKSINSLGKKKTRPTFYTGTGGNIYIYWKQYLFYDKKKEYLDKFYLALKTNLSIREEIGEEESTNSFFMGDSGIYMFYCIYALEIKNEELFNKFFDKLIKLKTISENKYAEVELLYGTSGYLYSLLYLKKYILSRSQDPDISHIINNNKIKILDDTIIEIFNILINSGIKYMNLYKWNKCLLYPFPANEEDPQFYLGAAHGLIGVIYLLLSTIKYFPNLLEQKIEINSDENTLVSKLLIKNIKYIQSLQIKNTGNFPSDITGNDTGDCVHFCHGCVGAVHLFLLAEELFPKNNFKETALLCNKSLWERGLLYKGNGLCHGMSGIAYGLIKLFKGTNNELYLKEAVGICKGTYDPHVQKFVEEYRDPQRLRKGIPDTPYSLMEGEGGCLVMYYDLVKIILNKDKPNQDLLWGLFPGYEIF